MTENKNFSWISTKPLIIDTVYKNCNFSQHQPVEVGGKMQGVRLFPGDDTPRTFINCNLTNCVPPPGSTLTKSAPTIIGKNVIANTEEVDIDGEIIEVHDYVNRIYGSWWEGEYTYHDIPIDIKVRVR